MRWGFAIVGVVFVGLVLLETLSGQNRADRKPQSAAPTQKSLRSSLELSKAPLTQAVELRKKQQFQQAVQILRALIERRSENPKAWRELGINYFHLGNYEYAKTSFSIAIVQEPKNGRNHAWLSFTLERRGESAGAREAMKKAQQLGFSEKDRESVEKQILPIPLPPSGSAKSKVQNRD